MLKTTLLSLETSVISNLQFLFFYVFVVSKSTFIDYIRYILMRKIKDERHVSSRLRDMYFSLLMTDSVILRCDVRF